MKTLLRLSVMLCVAAAPAMTLAQDTSAEANYGEIRLESGFTPDPHIIPVRSGGSIDASDRYENCRGYISNAPDVRLRFEAGSLPLIISVDSDADTTLVVNAPDGRWYCDDDSGEGMNPSVRFNDPKDGRYEIWVGTYGRSETERARLEISELESR